jgi:RHS repeat-associated protein
MVTYEVKTGGLIDPILDTTDLSQNIVGQQRYFAYGEPRNTSGTLHTDRRFTGQREETGLGSLYDYNARYYSPLIGRFVSADTLVPGAGNPQAFNRYSYALSNPLKYTDPSGHVAICGVGCDEGNWSPTLGMYGVSLVGDWTLLEVLVIHKEARSQAAKLMNACGGACYNMTEQGLFRQVFGDTTISRDFTRPMITDPNTGQSRDWWECSAASMSCYGSPGASSSARLTRPVNSGLITHEFGHRFDYAIGYAGRNSLEQDTIWDASGRFVTGVNPATGAYERTATGYQCGTNPCMQHPLNFGDANDRRGSEDFADMYMIWVHGTFADNLAGRARNNWMNVNMAEWVTFATSR